MNGASADEGGSKASAAGVGERGSAARAVGRIPVLAGPTASGKSGAALLLAREFGLEIVSADAMQVYRGMDIGTAKPTAAERREIPHHLLDVADPSEPFSVARYVTLAEEAIVDVLSRGRVPLVTGGTGFYLRALSEGLSTVPPADPELQAPLWDAVAAGRLLELDAELRAAAPLDAQRAAKNPRRVVRSLEVLRSTGKPPSAFPRRSPRFAYRAAHLHPPMALLRPRIALRTQTMFAQGLVAEVTALLRRHPDQPTALQAIGYKEVAEFIRGHISESEAQQEVERATVRYAKRQRTWFGAEAPELRLDMTGDSATSELAAWMAAVVRGSWVGPGGAGDGG